MKGLLKRLLSKEEVKVKPISPKVETLRQELIKKYSENNPLKELVLSAPTLFNYICERPKNNQSFGEELHIYAFYYYVAQSVRLDNWNLYYESIEEISVERIDLELREKANYAVRNIFEATLKEAILDSSVSDEILSKMRKEYRTVCGGIDN